WFLMQLREPTLHDIRVLLEGGYIDNRRQAAARGETRLRNRASRASGVVKPIVLKDGRRFLPLPPLANTRKKGTAKSKPRPKRAAPEAVRLARVRAKVKRLQLRYERTKR